MYVDTDDTEVRAVFYYDGLVNEENAEAVECTLTEIISDYSQSDWERVHFNYKRLDLMLQLHHPMKDTAVL